MTDVFHKDQSKPLNENQKIFVQNIKTQAEELYEVFDEAFKVYPNSPRELALAKTNLEQAVMWAVKGVTR